MKEKFENKDITQEIIKSGIFDNIISFEKIYKSNIFERPSYEIKNAKILDNFLSFGKGFLFEFVEIEYEIFKNIIKLRCFIDKNSVYDSLEEPDLIINYSLKDVLINNLNPILKY